MQLALPSHIFDGFHELRFEDRFAFRALVEGVLDNYIESENVKEKSLHFPSTLDSQCRQMIH
jgi:hypothetical protein